MPKLLVFDSRSTTATQMSKKRKVIEVRVTPMRTEIIITATRTQKVLAKYHCLYSHRSHPLLQVIISGKLRAQHAKSMKFKDGYMISSGPPVKEYIDSAGRHVLIRQGVLGIKVKIMLDRDPKGKQGPTAPLLDQVTIHAPKEGEDYIPPMLAPAIEVVA